MCITARCLLRIQNIPIFASSYPSTPHAFFITALPIENTTNQVKARSARLPSCVSYVCGTASLRFEPVTFVEDQTPYNPQRALYNSSLPIRFGWDWRRGSFFVWWCGCGDVSAESSASIVEDARSFGTNIFIDSSKFTSFM